MKQFTIKLTTEELLFLSERLIKIQLRNPDIVKAHCYSYCASESEAQEQIKWHKTMLEKIWNLEPIKSLNQKIEKAIEDHI